LIGKIQIAEPDQIVDDSERDKEQKVGGQLEFTFSVESWPGHWLVAGCLFQSAPHVFVFFEFFNLFCLCFRHSV